MYSYYFLFIVGILALLLNQSTAFTLSSSSTSAACQSYKHITSRSSSIQSSFTTSTHLSMSLPTSSSSSSSVSRRGFLESVAVSCGSQSLLVDMTADQVKDEGIHDMLELLVGDSDDDNREFSSCLSDAISDMNHQEEEVARYLPLAEQLVE